MPQRHKPAAEDPEEMVMDVGGFDVEVVTEPATCGTCLKGSILTIDGQPQCSECAGMRFSSEPAVLGDLVLGLLLSRVAV